MSRISGMRDRDGRAEPPGAVDPGGLVDLRRHALDRGDEQDHVEADEAPDDDEHHRGHGGARSSPSQAKDSNWSSPSAVSMPFSRPVLGSYTCAQMSPITMAGMT